MAERIDGLSIGLSLDTLEVDAGLKDLKSSMGLLNTELKANMSQFDRSEKSLGKYQTQLDGLTKKIELQQKVTDKAADNYEKMVDEFGEGSKEAQKAAKEYNNQSASLQNLERYADGVRDSMKKLSKEQDAANSSWGKFSKRMEGVSKSLKDVGGKMTSIGEEMSKKVTAPILAGGGLLLKQASDIEGSQMRVQNALGLTSDQAEKVADVARNIYKEGWGESLEHVEEGMMAVVEQLGLMDDPQALENVTRKAMQLEEAFGMDMNESLRGINALMQTYGMTADEAFDYMTVGAQNGLDKTDELGDNLAEYATLFEENGYSAEEMFSVLQAGLDAGAYNLDKVNDLVKEFGIRVSDGTIKDAVADMGGEWQKIYAGWEKAGGTNDELFTLMAQNLAGIEDPQKKQLALTEIWGSMGEDAGYKIIEAMGEVQDQYGNVAGATDEMIANTDEAFGPRFTSLLRSAADSFLPLGEVLLDMAEDYLPRLTNWVEDLTNWFAELDRGTLETGATFAGLAAAIGPLLLVGGNLVSSLGSIAGGLSKVTGWIAGKVGLSSALGVLGGSFGTTLAAMAPWAAGIGAVIAGGKLLYDHFSKEAIPAVDGFGDEVSETTTQAVLDFQALHTGAETEMTLLFSSTEPITAEGTAVLSGLFTQMYETIKTAGEENKNEQIGILQALFNETGGKIDENEQILMEKVSGHYTNRDIQLENMYARQQGILQTAAQEERALTEKEEQELARLNNEMQSLAIETLSASEQEQLIIKETMSQQKGAIDARTAADTVKRSREAKEGVVKEATEQYEQRIAAIAYERDVTGSISAEEADELISQAGRSKRETIFEAERKHKGVVREAKLQAEGHIREVDWETGEVLSKWQVFGNSLERWVTNLGDTMSDKWAEIRENAKKIPGQIQEGWASTKQQFADELSSWINAGAKELEGGLNNIIGGINTVLNWFGSDKKIDSVQLVTTTGGKRGGGRNNRRYAEGTDDHPGGWGLVGDGGMKELLLFPDGRMGLSPATDTILDMPKGTKVISGPETRDLLGSIPAYKEGTGGTVWDKLKGYAGNIWDWAAGGAKSIMDNLTEKLNLRPPKVKGEVFGEILGGAWNTVKNAATNFIEGQIPSFGGDFDFGNLRLTSRYGPRKSPGGFGSTYHRGIDLAGPMGTPIKSQSAGTVTTSRFHRTAGNYINVSQGPWTYRYLHNMRNLVSQGDRVTRGQTIALLGSTGASTGPHLHFEVLKNGKYLDPLSIADDNVGRNGGGGNVNRWRGVATQALRMTGQYSAGNLSRLLHQMQTESGGNPQAINNWDSNARRGTPSKGLMQVIDPTFRAYRQPGYNNIWNPLDNILASIRYATSRYGSLTRAYRGVGYATGGLISDEGLYQLAEGGHPEFVIPTDPSRRTDAMKLLALAGKRIKGDNNKRPNQLPNVKADGEQGKLERILNELLELLRLLKDSEGTPINIRIGEETIVSTIIDLLDKRTGQRVTDTEGRIFTP